MPPRKSNVSTATNGDEEAATPAKSSRESLGVEVCLPSLYVVRSTNEEQDLSLPRTMIQRLAKGVLPPNTQIQKDALLALSKSATVFVNYLASKYVLSSAVEAQALDNSCHQSSMLIVLSSSSEIALSSGKKTINPRDVYAALQDLEFDSFLPRVKAEVESKSTP